ncbi:MAG: RluA family pseudouridine synthase [Candidatus Jorgensenbacteria bacterium]
MISVIYEDENLLALSKPAGVLVHPSSFSKEDKGQATVTDWLLKNYPEVKMVGDNPAERPGIVHRLDRETSGVLLVARNQKTFEYLKKLFQEHKVVKTYLALVWGRLSGSGIIDVPIGLKPGTVRRVVRGKALKMVKEAVTEYRALKTFKKGDDEFTLVELTPKTGRTHQLRVHMKSINHPVVGDVLYSPKKDPFNLSRQFLHAESIEFTKSDGSRLKLEAELPNELKTVIDSLS